MRIDQVIPAARYSHDIGDTVMVLQKLINHLGFESDILTETTLAGRRYGTIIYHMFMGSKACKALDDLKPRRKFLFYHGIVPPKFFDGHEVQADLLMGLKDLKTLKNHFAFAFTATSYLENELSDAGYRRTAVLPLLLDLKEYDRKPDGELLEKYNDDFTNILYVGQITPNKKLEDTISIFNYYHKKINPKSRLFLVGSFSAHPGYVQKLLALIRELDINNVFLTGRVSFRQLLAYYRISRVFMLMSEYEGYSIPSVEAMYLKVPVIALNRAAVPEVLGGAGCLIDDNDVPETARLLDRIVNDGDLRKKIIDRQSERAAAFLPGKIFPMYRLALEQAYLFSA